MCLNPTIIATHKRPISSVDDPGYFRILPESVRDFVPPHFALRSEGTACNSAGDENNRPKLPQSSPLETIRHRCGFHREKIGNGKLNAETGGKYESRRAEAPPPRYSRTPESRQNTCAINLPATGVAGKSRASSMVRRPRHIQSAARVHSHARPGSAASSVPTSANQRRACSSGSTV